MFLDVHYILSVKVSSTKTNNLGARTKFQNANRLGLAVLGSEISIWSTSIIFRHCSCIYTLRTCRATAIILQNMENLIPQQRRRRTARKRKRKKRRRGKTGKNKWSTRFCNVSIKWIYAYWWIIAPTYVLWCVFVLLYNRKSKTNLSSEVHTNCCRLR